jgi:SAM-dependent methyltransferase
MSNHWNAYHARWAAVKPPLRPVPQVVTVVRDLAGTGGSAEAPVLLLGVTPEFAVGFDCVTAVDKARGMIEHIWPGDTARRRAIEGNWLTLPVAPDSHCAAVGDGSFNAVAFPHESERVADQVAAALRPGGRVVFRLYERPTPPPLLTAMLEDVAAGGFGNFHAFKWLLAMHIAETSGGTVAAPDILAVFSELYPDRERLAALTGWSPEEISTIDSYKDSSVEFSFPNRREFTDLFSQRFVNVRFHSCGGYPLAECCPIVSCEKA